MSRINNHMVIQVYQLLHQAFFVTHTHPFLGATRDNPDGAVHDPSEIANLFGFLEIKYLLRQGLFCLQKHAMILLFAAPSTPKQMLQHSRELSHIYKCTTVRYKLKWQLRKDPGVTL